MPRRNLFNDAEVVEVDGHAPVETFTPPLEISDIEEDEVPRRMQVHESWWLPYLRCDESWEAIQREVFCGRRGGGGIQRRGAGPGGVLRRVWSYRPGTHRDVPYVRELPRAEGEKSLAEDSGSSKS